MIQTRIIEHVAASLQRIQRQLRRCMSERMVMVVIVRVRRRTAAAVRVAVVVQIGRTGQLGDVAGAEALLDAERRRQGRTAADQVVALLEPHTLGDDVERPVRIRRT